MQTRQRFIAIAALAAILLAPLAIAHRAALTKLLGLAAATSVAGLVVSPAVAAEAKHESAGRAHLKYLLFYLSGANPEVPLGHPATVESRDQIASSVERVVRTIGRVGDHVHTQLGFSVGPLMFDLTDDQMRRLIADAFAVAEETNVAVAFHIDDLMFWNRRRDLWSDPTNVEWIDWQGTTVPHRLIEWVGGGAPVLAPPMCYNSPAIKAEASRVAQVIGREVRRGIDHLRRVGKSYLFAGVMAGWETRLQDQFGKNGEHYYAIYCSLHNLGFSAQNPPKNMDRALYDVVDDWIVLWARNLEAAGVPRHAIYTHIAFPGYPSPVAPFSNQIGHRFRDSVPFVTAFNRYSRPGFSVYGAEKFLELYHVLARYPATPWAVSEGTNVNLSQGFLGRARATSHDMEQYLGRAFNHGAVFVNLYGAFTKPHDSPFARAGESAEAVTAYRKFLSGVRLADRTGGAAARATAESRFFGARPPASGGNLGSKVQRI